MCFEYSTRFDYIPYTVHLIHVHIHNTNACAAFVEETRKTASSGRLKPHRLKVGATDTAALLNNRIVVVDVTMRKLSYLTLECVGENIRVHIHEKTHVVMLQYVSIYNHTIIG